MKFRYEGFTKSGDVKRGFIEADAQEVAAEKLREMGIYSNLLEPDGPSEMKTVLPGGQPLESKVHAEAVKEIETIIMGKSAKTAGQTWQENLKSDMERIARVAKYLEKNKELFADIPNPEFGKQLAVTESVKAAILRAISEA